MMLDSWQSVYGIAYKRAPRNDHWITGRPDICHASPLAAGQHYYVPRGPLLHWEGRAKNLAKGIRCDDMDATQYETLCAK